MKLSDITKLKWIKKKRRNRDFKNLFQSGTVKSLPIRKKFVLGDITRKSKRRGGN